MKNRYTYTEEELRTAIATSVSLHEVLKKLNLCAEGGAYASIRKRMTSLNIETSHLTGTHYIKQTDKSERSIEDYLSNKFRIDSCSLKKKLLKLGMIKAQCDDCKRVVRKADSARTTSH